MNAVILELEQLKANLEEQLAIAIHEQGTKEDKWENGYAVGSGSALETSIEGINEILEFATKLHSNS